MPSLKQRLNDGRRGLTIVQRHRDRVRAERALGRPLKTTEVVHHHTLTQLVICQDRAYHTLLHQREDVDASWEAEVAARFSNEAAALGRLIEAIEPGVFARFGIDPALLGTAASPLPRLRLMALSTLPNLSTNGGIPAT